MNDAAPAIRLTAIDKHFGPVHANRRASLVGGAGESHALVGANGAGNVFVRDVNGLMWELVQSAAQ